MSNLFEGEFQLVSEGFVGQQPDVDDQVHSWIQLCLLYDAAYGVETSCYDLEEPRTYRLL